MTAALPVHDPPWLGYGIDRLAITCAHQQHEVGFSGEMAVENGRRLRRARRGVVESLALQAPEQLETEDSEQRQRNQGCKQYPTCAAHNEVRVSRKHGESFAYLIERTSPRPMGAAMVRSPISRLD